MDYKKLERSTKSLLEPYPHLFITYENTIREAIASQDLTLLLSNSIPNRIWANCIAMSLRATADHAKRESLTSIAEQLWNPIVDSLLQMLSKQVSAEVTRPLKTVKTVQKKVQKPRSEAQPPKVDAQTVRDQLMQIVDSPNLFSTPGHKHVKCATPSCQFCSTLFKQLHITKCTGHAPCHPSGYYPHVGKPLWNMLKSKHARSTSCKLNKRPCKDGEYPCLEDSLNEKTGDEENVLFDDQPDWLEQPVDSNDSDRSEVYYPVVPKRPNTSVLH